MRGSLTGAVTS